MTLTFKAIASDQDFKSLYFELHTTPPNLNIDYFFLFAFLLYNSDSEGYVNFLSLSPQRFTNNILSEKKVCKLTFCDQLLQRDSNRAVFVCLYKV